MKKSLTNKQGEVRSLTKGDIKTMRPMKDVLPKSLVGVIAKRKRGQRGMQKAPKKTPLTVRYDNDVVNFFKKTGKGWQSRMNDTLVKYVKKHHV